MPGRLSALMEQHPRDFVGYGATPPDPKWPNGARLAVQIVMNYEEGSEYALGDGDETSETYLTEVPGATLAATFTVNVMTTEPEAGILNVPNTGLVSPTTGFTTAVLVEPPLRTMLPVEA